MPGNSPEVDIFFRTIIFEKQKLVTNEVFDG